MTAEELFELAIGRNRIVALQARHGQFICGGFRRWLDHAVDIGLLVKRRRRYYLTDDGWWAASSITGQT